MRSTGQWSPAQAAGRRWTMGCVSLEVTQRCNLDCTLCYLSDSAEAVRDIPLQDLFRRIDGIAVQFGPNTDVQISGGDPTLRDRAELSQIVRGACGPRC
jgi:7,8-dihydro-6-hydroxymethylpterin dimethyltransferase